MDTSAQTFVCFSSSSSRLSQEFPFLMAGWIKKPTAFPPSPSAISPYPDLSNSHHYLNSNLILSILMIPGVSSALSVRDWHLVSSAQLFPGSPLCSSLTVSHKRLLGQFLCPSFHENSRIFLILIFVLYCFLMFLTFWLRYLYKT